MKLTFKSDLFLEIKFLSPSPRQIHRYIHTSTTILEGFNSHRTVHGTAKRDGKGMATGKVLARDRTDRDTRILSVKGMDMATD